MQIPYEGFDDNVFDTYVRKIMSDFPTPGLTILVATESSTWSRSYGYSDLAKHITTNSDTLFCIDSLTKSFTAAAASCLVKSSKNSSSFWSTPMKNFIPEDFVLASGTTLGEWASNHVTLEDALSHRTGMPRHDWVAENGDASIREIVRSMRHLPLKNELRQKYGYTNIMYTAVVHALQVETNQTFTDVLRNEIFEPLGMRSTYSCLREAQKDIMGREDVQLARCHLWNPRTEKFWPVPWDDIPPARGGGGMVSSASDLGLWMQHLMFPSNKTHALSASTVNEMQTPKIIQKQASDGPFLGTLASGMGLDVGVYHSHRIAFHGGAGHGSMSMMILVLPQSSSQAAKTDKGYGILVLQNGRSQARKIISWYLLDAFLRVPVEKRRDMVGQARKARARQFDSSSKMSDVTPPSPATLSIGSLDLGISAGNFEGLYRHPAYHYLRVSITPPLHATLSEEDEEMDRKAVRLFLYSGSNKSYLGRFAVLTPIAGLQWHSNQSVGIFSPETSSSRKLEFVMAADKTVKGLKYEVEKTIGMDLAYFEKVVD